MKSLIMAALIILTATTAEASREKVANCIIGAEQATTIMLSLQNEVNLFEVAMKYSEGWMEIIMAAYNVDIAESSEAKALVAKLFGAKFKLACLKQI